MDEPIADSKPHATFVFNHEGEEYVLRSDYERLRALVPDSRDTLRAQWNAMHGVGRWISVSERLPDQHQEVIGWWGDTPQPHAGFAWIDDNGVWNSDSDYPDPTHWMPLPEPPTN
jgi:hypothetical protein